MNKMFFECHSFSSLSQVLPSSIRDIERLVEDTICLLEEEVERVIHIPLAEQTYANLVHMIDQISGYVAYTGSRLQFITMVSPNAELRTSAQNGSLRLSAALIDVVEGNKTLYNLLRIYAQETAPKQNLTGEQLRLLERILRNLERGGLALPNDQLERVKEIKKELSRLTLEFQIAINTDIKTYICSRDELAGLDENFIANLPLDGQGNVTVRLDMASYSRIKDYCTNAKTRQQCWELYVNRAYPQNYATLQEIMKLRFELARTLGFASYAHLNTDDQMAKNPERVKEFLRQLAGYGAPAFAQEFTDWTAQLPEGVALVDGQIAPWDLSFVVEAYKKRVLCVDQQNIKKYFPVQRTLDEMLSLYEQFLGIEFRQEPVPGLWHESVRYVGVYRNDILLGHLFLDLYPRDFKYTHACQVGLSPALLDEQGKVVPAIIGIIANFPTASASGEPALLSFDEVKTFFHEFGHAMHSVLGATHAVEFSGTNVPIDFVEVPSQMFEEWLHEPEVLRRLSYHYQTGEPLPEDIIQKLCSLRSFGMGYFIQRQSALADLALQLFGKDPEIAIDLCDQELRTAYLPYIQSNKKDHFAASFGHLAGYGALYYSYLWSKVYAVILFAHIKRMGLFSTETGNRFIQAVLSRGGTVDPQEMLRDFCGQEPELELFFSELGLLRS